MPQVKVISKLLKSLIEQCHANVEAKMMMELLHYKENGTKEYLQFLVG